jgi:hypothetical protein
VKIQSHVPLGSAAILRLYFNPLDVLGKLALSKLVLVLLLPFGQVPYRLNLVLVYQSIDLNTEASKALRKRAQTERLDLETLKSHIVECPVERKITVPSETCFKVAVPHQLFLSAYVLCQLVVKEPFEELDIALLRTNGECFHVDCPLSIVVVD